MPQRIARHLADALQVDEANHRHRHLGDPATAARRGGSTYSSRETAYRTPRLAQSAGSPGAAAFFGSVGVPRLDRGGELPTNNASGSLASKKCGLFKSMREGQGRPGYQRHRAPTIGADPFCFKGLERPAPRFVADVGSQGNSFEILSKCGRKSANSPVGPGPRIAASVSKAPYLTPC
jgi:hypothetical protein